VGGQHVTPYMTFIPDLVHHADALPGNDRINVDTLGNLVDDPGHDMIFGDNATFVAPILSGFAPIEAALAQNANELTGALRAFHVAGLDFDQYLHTHYGAVEQSLVSIGNDVINGGSGDDTIFGDEGRVVMPSLLGLPVPAAQLKQTVLDYYDQLRDFQQVAVDVEFALLETQAQVLTNLVADAKAAGATRPASGYLPNPHYHTLALGNDTISGGLGGDLVIGDAGTVLAPFLTSTAINNGGVNTAAVNATTLRVVNAALKAEVTVRDRQLASHIKLHHALPATNSAKSHFPKTEDMRLIIPDYDHELFSGNDTLLGDAGDDVLIGDTGMLYLPTVLATPQNNARTALSIETELTNLTKSLAGYLGQGNVNAARSSFGAVSRPAYQGRGDASRYAVVNSGNDLFDGGNDNDLISGDNASIATPFIAKEPASQVGAKTAKLDVQSLIRNFGQPLPGQSLTRSLVVHNTAINQRPAALGGGTQGRDVADGGSGDDLLFGARNDVLTDTLGVNYVDTDSKQRNSPRLRSGANYQLASTIRGFLQSLASNGMTQGIGKDARVTTPVREVSPAVPPIGDDTASLVTPIVPTHSLDTAPVSVLPPAPTPAAAGTNWFTNLLKRLRG
jgi:Ca2+-binding RTX toxin-like protein